MKFNKITIKFICQKLDYLSISQNKLNTHSLDFSKQLNVIYIIIKIIRYIINFIKLKIVTISYFY